MKQLGVAFAVIFVLAAGGFGISALKDYRQAEERYISVGKPTGDKAEMFEDIIMDGNEYGMKVNINEQFNSTEINVVSAGIEITKGNSDKATVEYINGNKRRHLNVAVRSGILEIEEKYDFSIFNFDFTRGARVIVELPEQDYNRIKTTSVSGEISIERLEADEFEFYTTSGKVEADIFADKITAKSVSGDINLENIQRDKAITDLNIATTSGELVINGFASEKTTFKTISGDVEAYGLAGKVEVSTTSGTIELDYASWNGDLQAKSVSGDIEILLPQNSSASVSTSSVSGDVSYNNAKIGKGTNGITNIEGSGERYKISLNSVSGDLSINCR